jgi:diacylglycerol kinase (ATP)
MAGAEDQTRWRAVVNPTAGKGRTRKLLPQLREAFAACPLDVDVRVSADGSDAVRLAHEALDDGRAVVACGGDGTVNALAGVAAERGGLLGIVPTGSGNDFAGHLGLDWKRWRDAIEVLATGRVGLVDLGRAELIGDGTTAWFASVANAGFDSEANRWANAVEWATGTTLYVLAVVRTLAVYKPRRFRLTVDGDAHDVEAWLIAVGNGRGYAGGMLITPGAQLDDGELDVCVVGPVSRAGFLRSFPRVFKGTHTTHPQVSMFRGKVIELASLDPAGTDELYGSGERIGPLPARMEAVPAAVRVKVPPTAPVPKEPEPLT